jgi:hypothetical protein
MLVVCVCVCLTVCVNVGCSVRVGHRACVSVRVLVGYGVWVSGCASVTKVVLLSVPNVQSSTPLQLPWHTMMLPQ